MRKEAERRLSHYINVMRLNQTKSAVLSVQGAVAYFHPLFQLPATTAGTEKNMMFCQITET